MELSLYWKLKLNGHKIRQSNKLLQSVSCMDTGGFEIMCKHKIVFGFLTFQKNIMALEMSVNQGKCLMYYSRVNLLICLTEIYLFQRVEIKDTSLRAKTLRLYKYIYCCNFFGIKFYDKFQVVDKLANFFDPNIFGQPNQV